MTHIFYSNSYITAPRSRRSLSPLCSARTLCVMEGCPGAAAPVHLAAAHSHILIGIHADTWRGAPDIDTTFLPVVPATETAAPMQLRLGSGLKSVQP